MTAFSISAEELLRQSPDRYALLLLQRLPQLEDLRRKANSEGESTNIFSWTSTTSPSQAKMEKEPLDALGSPPYTDMGSYPYSGPPTDLADTVSLLRQPRGPVWRPELPITSRSPEVCPAYVKAPHLPEPTHGDLDCTAELLAKLLSGSEDPDVTASSQAVKAKSGITEPLPQPALASPPPGLSTLADALKRSRVSRLLPKVTCPSPFHPRARTVPIAELQDVPVTETEKRGLSALAPLAGVPRPSSGPTPGGGKSGRPIAQATIQLKLPECKCCPGLMRGPEGSGPARPGRQLCGDAT